MCVCVGVCIVCSVVGALGSEVDFPPGLQATGTLASGGGLLGAPVDDDDALEELSDELSGGADSMGHVLLHGMLPLNSHFYQPTSDQCSMPYTVQSFSSRYTETTEV